MFEEDQPTQRWVTLCMPSHHHLAGLKVKIMKNNGIVFHHLSVLSIIHPLCNQLEYTALEHTTLYISWVTVV